MKNSCQSACVSDKEIALDVFKRMPQQASLAQIARELEFVAAVREGFEELDRGEGLPIEEVEKQLPSWITK